MIPFTPTGGSVQIVVDIDAITDASETNPDLQVVDSFTLQLLQVDELANISDSCAIEVGVTETGAVQLVFRSLSEEDTEFCFQASKVRAMVSVRHEITHTSDKSRNLCMKTDNQVAIKHNL